MNDSSICEIETPITKKRRVEFTNNITKSIPHINNDNDIIDSDDENGLLNNNSNIVTFSPALDSIIESWNFKGDLRIE